MGKSDSIDAAATRLTEGQIACLRGVLEMKSSKEIAQDLGISSHTVDRRLKDAMRLLGAHTRLEAARLLVDAGKADYQRLAYQSPAVGSTAGSSQSLRSGVPVATHFAEERVEFDPSAFAKVGDLGSLGRRWRHGLTAGQKLLMVLAVMLAAPLFLGALANALILAEKIYLSKP